MIAISKKLGILTLAMVSVLGGDVLAGTLDDIRQSKTLRLAYREEAKPFAYKTPAGQPAGFMIDLCQAVAKHMGQQLKIPDLKVAEVIGWEDGETPIVPEGLVVTAYAQDLANPRTVHTLPNGDVLVVQS